MIMRKVESCDTLFDENSCHSTLLVLKKFLLHGPDSTPQDKNTDERIKNLRNRASREFYYDHRNEALSSEHYQHLCSLFEKYPLNNYIYGNMFCLFCVVEYIIR